MKVKGKMGQKNNKLKREGTKKSNGKEIKRLKRVYYFYHPPHSRGFSQRILKQLQMKPNWKIVNDPTKADYIDDVWSNHKLVSKNQTLNRVPYGQLLQNKYTLAQLFKDYWGKYLPETYIFKGKDWITESPLTKNYNKKTIWFLKVPHIDKSYGIYIDKDLNKLVKQAKKLSNSGNGNRKRVESKRVRGKRMEKQRPLIFQPHIKQPALFRGKKFDIRMHVALLYHPDGRFETFLYYNGFIKTSPNKWIYGKLDRDTQLSSITSFLDLYNSKKNKMPFDQALSIIRKHRIPFSEWIYYHQALPKIRAMFSELFNGVLKKQILENRDKFPKKAFQIMGTDVMLDKDFNPFLLEMNVNPDMSSRIYVKRLRKLCFQHCIKDYLHYLVLPLVLKDEVRDKDGGGWLHLKGN